MDRTSLRYMIGLAFIEDIFMLQSGVRYCEEKDYAVFGIIFMCLTSGLNTGLSRCRFTVVKFKKKGGKIEQI